MPCMRRAKTHGRDDGRRQRVTITPSRIAVGASCAVAVAVVVTNGIVGSLV